MEIYAYEIKITPQKVEKKRKVTFFIKDYKIENGRGRITFLLKSKSVPIKFIMMRTAGGLLFLESLEANSDGEFKQIQIGDLESRNTFIADQIKKNLLDRYTRKEISNAFPLLEGFVSDKYRDFI